MPLNKERNDIISFALNTHYFLSPAVASSLILLKMLSVPNYLPSLTVEYFPTSHTRYIPFRTWKKLRLNFQTVLLELKRMAATLSTICNSFWVCGLTGDLVCLFIYLFIPNSTSHPFYPVTYSQFFKALSVQITSKNQSKSDLVHFLKFSRYSWGFG